MRSTTACASPFAAHDATRRFDDWTVSETSGFWPFFDRFPEIGCVEMPPRKVLGFVLHCRATRPTTAGDVAIARTVLGFVCSVWSAMLPLAEYGWPR